MERLESQLKSLGRVKPDREWASSLKSEIVGQPSFGFVWSHVYMAVCGVALVFFVGLGLYNQNVRFPRVSSADFSELREVNMDLRSVNADLLLAREGIDRINEAQQAVEIKDKVAKTVEDAKRVVETSKEVIKDSEKGYSTSEEAFTVVSGVSWATSEVERATRDLEEAYLIRQREVAKQEIEDMEGRSLTEEQSALLQEAKDLYNSGQFEQALIKVLDI